MDCLDGADAAFLHTFRLAATVTITALPPEVSDDTVKTTIHNFVENINTDTEKTKVAVDIIYERAMQDKNWTDVVVKLFDLLYHALPVTLINSDTSDGNVDASLANQHLVRKCRFNRLQHDFEMEMEGPEWSTPCIWLLAKLGEECLPPLGMSHSIIIDISRKMAESEYRCLVNVHKRASPIV